MILLGGELGITFDVGSRVQKYIMRTSTPLPPNIAGKKISNGRMTFNFFGFLNLRGGGPGPLDTRLGRPGVQEYMRTSPPHKYENCII